MGYRREAEAIRIVEAIASAVEVLRMEDRNGYVAAIITLPAAVIDQAQRFVQDEK